MQPFQRRSIGHCSLVMKALLAGLLAVAATPAFGQTHVVEVLADKDSRYKIDGQKVPEITLKAGEPVLLRISARRGKTWNKDGTIHGFTLLRAKDRKKVLGWNLQLHEGTEDFNLTAPLEPGEYEVICTVICSDDHEGMRMKLVVLP